MASVEETLQAVHAAHIKMLNALADSNEQTLQRSTLQYERKLKRTREQRDDWRETALRYQKELAQTRTALIELKRATKERTA